MSLSLDHHLTYLDLVIRIPKFIFFAGLSLGPSFFLLVAISSVPRSSTSASSIVDVLFVLISIVFSIARLFIRVTVTVIIVARSVCFGILCALDLTPAL